VLYKHDEPFPEGGFKVLREGPRRLLRRRRLHGPRVPQGRRRAGQVRPQGDGDRRLRPADQRPEQILAIAARSGGTIITVEDNYTGGLDAEIATAIARTATT
jgi:hypothetical protein